MDGEFPTTVRIRLSDNVVKKATLAERGQKLLWDAELGGFALRIGKRRKVFVVQASVRGGARSKTITIGRADVIRADDARCEAKAILADMARGLDPNVERCRVKADKYSLENAYEDHVTATQLQESTRISYARSLNKYLRDWKDKPLTQITRSMVLERHRHISDRHGPYQANETFRNMRAWLNTSLAMHEGLSFINPVIVLKGKWNRQHRRKHYLKRQDLPKWFDAVLRLSNQDAADYLQLLLFTGLRKMEGARLKWADIDFKQETLRITRTKNGEQLLLPMSDYLVRLLRARRVDAGDSEYVFPSSRSSTQHMREIVAPIAAVKRISSLVFSLHDLRRTFVTMAEGLEISPYAIKRLVNHKLSSADVTAGYIGEDIERLRVPMQRICDQILESAGSLPRDKWLPRPSRSAFWDVDHNGPLFDGCESGA